MCSIATNATADQQLKSLSSSGDDELIENKLRDFAGNSNVTQSGVLDLPKYHLHGMPSDLKHIRRIRIGRHRVFYFGYHTQCSYSVFYVKGFKKKGVEDESDPSFHKVLEKVVDEPPTARVIRKPDKAKPR